MPMTTRQSVGTVYVARIAYGYHAGLVKVGFTQQLDTRMKQLEARLIASAPGSYLQEQELLALCPREYAAGREWFNDDRVLAVIAPAWQRLFGHAFPIETMPCPTCAGAGVIERSAA